MTHADPHRFSQLEWIVIAIAERERRGAVCFETKPSSFRRVRRWLLVEHVHRPLASPRLETLRRTALSAWHDPLGVSAEQRHAFLAAGFCEAQFQLILRICASRSLRRNIDAKTTFQRTIS